MTHFGTHLDAPNHFIKNGLSIDQIPLERFITRALVIMINHDEIIQSDIPEQDLSNISLLFKTQNSHNLINNKFVEDYAYLSFQAAQKLTEKHVNLVALDYITIDKFNDESFPVHQQLLKNNILILEAVDLSHVKPGEYQLIVLPLKIKNGDGSPVRAILIQE